MTAAEALHAVVSAEAALATARRALVDAAEAELAGIAERGRYPGARQLRGYIVHFDERLGEWCAWCGAIQHFGPTPADVIRKAGLAI